MSKPTFKKISNIEQASLDDGDCIFYLKYSDDMTEIGLTISAKRAMSPDEFMTALAEFVNDASEFPEKLFVEDLPEESHDLH